MEIKDLNKIYLQYGNCLAKPNEGIRLDAIEVTWSSDQINSDDLEYVRNPHLIELIENAEILLDIKYFGSGFTKKEYGLKLLEKLILEIKEKLKSNKT